VPGSWISTSFSGWRESYQRVGTEDKDPADELFDLIEAYEQRVATV